MDTKEAGQAFVKAMTTEDTEYKQTFWEAFNFAMQKVLSGEINPSLMSDTELDILAQQLSDEYLSNKSNV